MTPFPSLWSATADAVPAPDCPPLAGAARADTAVIGGGFTGLATALRLAEGGAEVILLDAERPGFGASGRNGGQVIPGLKVDPEALDRMFGPATTEFAGETAQTAFALIKRLGIDCAAQQGGWIQASMKTAQLHLAEDRVRAWSKRGADVALLDAGDMARATGSDAFAGGWIDRRAGSLHPLRYARGLARAAQAAGARLHGQSRVTGLKRMGNQWQLTLPGATVHADQVVIATNGYTDGLWPGLKATVVPANSFQIATEILPEPLRQQILPAASALSETRRIGTYYRLSPDGRFMIGGRGSFREPRCPSAFAGLIAEMARFYPALARATIAYRWAGRVAMTRDHLPHLHQPAPGLTVALGYNGRGVALSSAMGLAIAAHLLDARQPLPFRPGPVAPMPLHRLHPIYASMAIWGYRLRDALER